MMIAGYIILGIIALFLLLQFSMVAAAKKSQGLKLEGLNSKLKSLEKKGTKGLVYFFSPSCGACKAQTPIIKSMQKSNKNVFDVDISSDIQTARVFGVKATPTTVIVKNGIVDKVFLGVKQKDFFEKYLREI